MQLLDGKKLSEEIKSEIKETVQSITNQGKRPPHLVAILVGDNGASKTYVNNKVKSCNQVGFESTLIHLSKNTSEEKLLKQVKLLNKDKTVDGFIVQLPLPNHINQEKIIMAINPKKDVDGFHPENFGKMALNMSTFLPATPFGIMELLKRNNIKTSGKKTVIIGRSRIVGTPMGLLLGRNDNLGNSTVTIAHSRTENLSELTKNADIIVTALGVPYFLKENMIKEGVVIIDVGITRIEDATRKRGYRLAGDVDFENVASKTSWITPVPGGVGPMTVTMLLKNTLIAYEQSSYLS